MVWNIYIRIFHLALAVSIITSYVALEINDIYLHMQSGIIIIGLLIFRILWGIFGSQTARFVDFIKGPVSVLKYLKSGYSSSRGHTPLGSLSVLAMLGMIGFQVVAGLFASSPDSFIYAPLANEVSSGTSKWFTSWHKTNGEWIKYIIAIHIAAILVYLIFKKKNLTGPMITGYRKLDDNSDELIMQVKHGRAWITILLATATLYYFYSL